MQYISEYLSPLGKIVLAADDKGLIGLWFDGQKYFKRGLTDNAVKKDTEILRSAESWLDLYFSGRRPEFTPKLHMIGKDFQKAVWNKLLQVPYGNTTTYGNIAKEIAEENNKGKVSPQAVGGAVGHNPISIIVPCHRVVGSRGQLTGYAGGLDRKQRLLEMERR